MKRIYKDTATTDAVTVFTGVEIEHTPAFGMRTLFIVGLQNPLDIVRIAQEQKCQHIYTGANATFDPTIDDTSWSAWNNMISELLIHKNKYWVTLDFDVKHCEHVHEMGFCENQRFIPQISVKIPHLTLFNYNATLKVDDVDFEATNAGVWCHKLNTLLVDNRFTNWDQYGKDAVIK